MVENYSTLPTRAQQRGGGTISDYRRWHFSSTVFACILSGVVLSWRETAATGASVGIFPPVFCRWRVRRLAFRFDDEHCFPDGDAACVRHRRRGCPSRHFTARSFGFKIRSFGFIKTGGTLGALEGEGRRRRGWGPAATRKPPFYKAFAGHSRGLSPQTADGRHTPSSARAGT